MTEINLLCSVKVHGYIVRIDFFKRYNHLDNVCKFILHSNYENVQLETHLTKFLQQIQCHCCLSVYISFKPSLTFSPNSYILNPWQIFIWFFILIWSHFLKLQFSPFSRVYLKTVYYDSQIQKKMFTHLNTTYWVVNREEGACEMHSAANFSKCLLSLISLVLFLLHPFG